MKKKITALIGSTRQHSSNHALIRAIQKIFANRLDIDIFPSLAGIPPFNPDLDQEYPPESVKQFRLALKQADGIIICTPEYAHGVPGTLKNAIDWLVSSSGLYRQAVLLITASTDGKYAHQSMLETLKVLDTRETEALQLLIPFIKTKLNADGQITDEKTFQEIKEVVEKLIAVITPL